MKFHHIMLTISAATWVAIIYFIYYLIKSKPAGRDKTRLLAVKEKFNLFTNLKFN